MTVFGRFVDPGEVPSHEAPAEPPGRVARLARPLALGGRAVTAAPARAYGLALLAGLAPALLLASSCVALRFRFAPELGTPLWWHLYDPLAVVRWAWSWGLAPGYRDDFLRGLSLAVVPLLLPAAALRLREMRAPPEPDERPAGSRLGTAADLRRLGTFRRRGPGVVVGLDGGRPLFETGDVHALVLGPTRAGKGANNIVPTLLTWTNSAVVLDFKGELASIAGPMRAHLGKVYTIDATSPRSARFNPLLAVRTGPEMITDAQALAHMLVHPDLDVRAGDTIWNDATALTVTALLIAARLSPEPTLGRFYRLQADLQAKRPIACAHPGRPRCSTGSGTCGRTRRAAPSCSTSTPVSPSWRASSSKPS